MNQYKEIKKELDRDARQKKKCAQKHTLCMNVTNDTGFLSPFSANDTPVISSDVADFIEASTLSIKPSSNLTLKIKSNCIDETEKVLYKRAIKEYYTDKYISSGRKLARNRAFAISLAIVGVLVLLLALLLEYWTSSIWLEIINVVAWVFLWEATYIYFIESRNLKHDRKKYVSYVAMNVEFEDS